MAVVVSWCHVFEEALWAEIITSDLQLFDFCCLLLLAQGQAALSFLPASGLGEGRGVTWPRCSAALTRGLLKSLSQLAAVYPLPHCVNTQEGTDSLCVYDCCSFPRPTAVFWFMKSPDTLPHCPDYFVSLGNAVKELQQSGSIYLTLFE